MTAIPAQDMESVLRQAQKMGALGQLTSGLAHDFNNLLTVILGNSEMLSNELRDQQQLRALADMICIAAERGAGLTERLLACAREQALQVRLVDIGSQVHGMESLLRRTLPESIDFQIIRAINLWQVEIDPAQLESALLNLALNARDAMPNGGQLSIEIANAAIDDDGAGEQELSAGQYVMVGVTDTGEGMPPAVLARVFEPFFTTKETSKGTGLGLSMVNGFVNQSGGHIRVDSEPGKGTSVRLYFRRAHNKDGQARSDRMGTAAVGGSESILVVEDDMLVREHLVACLIGLGYKVVAAESGPRSLEAIRQTPDLDLLVIDIVLPGGMNGRELADTACLLRPDLKLLLTSGYAADVIVHQDRLHRRIELLEKPFRRTTLASKVREVLDTR